MSPALLSAVAALMGSMIGAIASIATSWLTQYCQDRAQRRSQDIARREHLFSDFISLASKLFADALTHNLSDPSTLVPLYAVKAQIYIYARNKETIHHAEEALKFIVDAYYEPNKDFRSRESIESTPADFLQAFTIACRQELAASG
jgi:hypothetical protein